MKGLLFLVSVGAIASCQFDVSNTSTSEEPGTPTGQADGSTSTTDGSTSAVDAAPLPEPTYKAYWSFDTNVLDATGAHNGTLTGTASRTIGGQGFRGGEALMLTNDGDRMDIANPRDFDFNSDFTWHAYIKTANNSGAIFSRNPVGSGWNQGSKALFIRSSDVQWDTGWVGNPGTNVAIDDNAWHQIIATYRADTDALNIFVDPQVGDTVGSYSESHNVDRYDEHTHSHNQGIAETGFSLGQANFTGGLSDLNTLVGFIDEAAIFDRALEGEELDLLITSGPSAL